MQKEPVDNLINTRKWCEDRFPLLEEETSIVKNMNKFAVDKIESGEHIPPEAMGAFADLVVDSLNEIARRN